MVTTTSGPVVRAKGDDEAGAAPVWSSHSPDPTPPDPTRPQRQPASCAPSRVSRRAARGRCGPAAARGAAWSRPGAEGRPRGGRREERGISASRPLGCCSWRRQREWWERAARGPAFPGPAPPHAAGTMDARWGARGSGEPT